MEALGINFIWIIAYILIFFALYLVARKFVAQVLATVETRQNLIETGLKNAKEVETLKAERLKEVDIEKQKVLQEAYKQAQTIIDSAKAKEMKIIEEAHQKAGKSIADADSELESLKEKSKKEGLQEAKEIITLVVSKAFEGFELDKRTEEEVIEKSLELLKSKNG